MPSRGVSFDSGLEPPPHLVGERFRSLDVLEAGGLVCVSAAAIAEALPPSHARPEPISVRPGDETGVAGLAEQLSLAGYERVERAEERGQFAVRGGIVDVYPVTGREPVRVEFFGDEVEAIRAFSPFTQRALRSLDAALLYPASERRADLLDPGDLLSRDEVDRLVVPDDLVPPLPVDPDLVWRPSAVREAWVEELGEPRELPSASLLDPLPQGQAHSFEAQRPALAARGLAEAENELAELRARRHARRCGVSAPRRGAPDAEPPPPRRRRPDRGGRVPAAGARRRLRRLARPPRLRLARARARAAPGHAGLPPPRAARGREDRPRAAVVRRPAHRRLRRPRGSRRRQAARLRDEDGRRGHARLPVRRLPGRRPAVRAPRADRQGVALHRRRCARARALASSAARPGS